MTNQLGNFKTYYTLIEIIIIPMLFSSCIGFEAIIILPIFTNFQFEIVRILHCYSFILYFTFQKLEDISQNTKKEINQRTTQPENFNKKENITGRPHAESLLYVDYIVK